MTHWNTEAAPPARRAAYEGLYEIFEKSAYANLTLQHFFRHWTWKPEERRFLTELVYGVCRRYNYLLWILEQLSSRPLKKLDAKVRLLVCLGLYQLIFLNAVPDSAAVNEMVKIAKQVTHAGNVKFINAILRNYLRKKESFRIPADTEDPELHDALTYNEPVWLVHRWTEEWGREKAQAVFAALNRVADTDIRCNRLKISTEELIKKLEVIGAEPKRISFYEDGISLGASGPFFQSSLLRDGLAYVQNQASMLPACVLVPKAGETVLDMCAAPGSKTTQIAAMMGDQGRVDAWDLYPHKIQLIEGNCRRLGIHSVHAEARDASILHKPAVNRYDRVLLDAPCSGLGVLGRKTEMRWRRKETELEAFPILQKQLLQCAAAYVKPGGRLVYSTCTLNREENEQVVSEFLKIHPEFYLAPFSLPGIDGTSGMCTLWPDIHHSDGFFVASMTRRGL